MKSRGTLYGLMGFLSLLGFLGIFTETKAFLAFFAFAVDFSYFFQPSDEMLESTMNRSAARAFYCGMVATALVAFLAFFSGGTGEHNALLTGLSAGWAVAVIVHALSVAHDQFRESWGLRYDQE